MEKLIINLGASSDHFGAYAENCEGIYGAGNTVQDAKKNVMEGLRLFIEYNENNLPDILKGDYEIEWRYDTQSFFNYYNKVFNCAALERLTGINQKLLHHYASGLKKPRAAQRKKIEDSLHRLGRELLEVRL
jgi:predicted RNase H-like HicB family nuclease